MKENYYEIKIYLKSWNEITTPAYSKSTKFLPLFKLFRDGRQYIEDRFSAPLRRELEEVSKIHTHFLFELTERIDEKYFYRYWFRNGNTYGEEGSLAFDDFDENKLQ